MGKIGPVSFYVAAAAAENIWIPNVEYLHVTLFPKLQRKYFAWGRNFQTYPVCTKGWTIVQLLFSLLYAKQHPLVRYRWRPACTQPEHHALNWSAENATDQVQTTVILIQRYWDAFRKDHRGSLHCRVCRYLVHSKLREGDSFLEANSHSANRGICFSL